MIEKFEKYSSFDTEKFIQESITLLPSQYEKVQDMLDTTFIGGFSDFWKLPNVKEHYIPVKDGEIRVLHIDPPNKKSKRPLLFVPGWGGVPVGYVDTYAGFHDSVEFYYLETREKHTSHIKKRGSGFTMSQKAEDIDRAIKHLNLDSKDFVLYGACWGSAIILQGIMDGIIDAPTVVTFDPMNELWYSRFFLTYISPLIPEFMLGVLKPIIKWLKLRTIKEEIQKTRAEEFVKNASLWKWKRAAQQTKNFSLFGNLHKIGREIFVVNGTNDTIHDQTTYPRIARQLPNGRFIFLGTDENQRERLIGLLGREFSMISKDEGIPVCFREFEKDLHRI